MRITEDIAEEKMPLKIAVQLFPVSDEKYNSPSCIPVVAPMYMRLSIIIILFTVLLEGMLTLTLFQFNPRSVVTYKPKLVLAYRFIPIIAKFLTIGCHHC